MKRSAFTLMELMMGIMIIAITSMVVIVNVNAVSGQSAKREADKLAHWLVTRMTIADSRNKGFGLYVDDSKVEDEKIFIWWGASRVYRNKDDIESFDVSPGCNFRINDVSYGNLEYNPGKNEFGRGGHITVIGKEGPTAPYYVIVATIGGRVRVSDTKP